MTLLRSRLRRILRSGRGKVALLVFAPIALAAIAGPFIVTFGPDQIDLGNRLAPPSSPNWWGTDGIGRDVLTRWLHAARISISVALVAVCISLPIGTILGLVSGYFGGFIDALIMRITDAVLSVPLFLLLLIMLALFEPSLVGVILVIGMTTWMGVARLVRGEVLRVASQDFVLAARATGATRSRIVRVHIFPQVVPVLIVAANVGIPQAILLESTLSYFGLGVQPPTPTWGNMLADAQRFVWNAPWLAAWPGLGIVATVLSMNLLGEAVRQSLEPD